MFNRWNVNIYFPNCFQYDAAGTLAKTALERLERTTYELGKGR